MCQNLFGSLCMCNKGACLFLCRSSIGRRRLDGSSSLTPVAVATDDDDDVIFECEVCGRSLFEPSAAPRDRLKVTPRHLNKDRETNKQDKWRK